MKRREFLSGGVTGLLASGVLSARADDGAATGGTVFDVRDFGAKGDGKTPDSAAIQRALDAAGRVRGTVRFPAGVYRCHDLKAPPHVMLRGDPVWIFRPEKAGSVLELDDPNARCLLDVTGAFGVHVYGLLFAGIRETPKPVHGILLDQAKWSPKEDTCTFDDIKVMDFSGHGIYLNRVWLFIIRHSHFFRNGGDGVCLRGWDGFVTDNQFSNNGRHGFGCEEVGAAVMLTANRVEWNRGHGFHLLGGNDWNVTGNSFDRNWGAGLSVLNTEGITVTGNVFRRCGKDPSRLTPGEPSSQVRLERVRGLAMSGNSFLAGRDDGGTGKVTPEAGFWMKNLTCSVIKDNALYHGYTKTLAADEGGHGESFVFKDNVGREVG